MTSEVMGPDSVKAVLHRRGQVPVSTGSTRDILLPLNGERVLSGQEVNQYRQFFSRSSFRKVVRRIIATNGSANIDELTKIAGNATSGYVDFLVSLGVAEKSETVVSLTRKLNSIGPSLEWYVADLCKRELEGSAEWSVRLEGLPSGGDYDVLAWLPPILSYIEVKSSQPSEVSDSELRNFLQRSVELAPDMAVLLIDTDDKLDGLLDRLSEIMLPVVRTAGGITDPAWRPERPFIHLQMGFPGVSFGYYRTYVTNSEPSILTQIRRCLQHYHSLVKGQAFYGGPPVNFVTGSVGEQP